LVVSLGEALDDDGGNPLNLAQALEASREVQEELERFIV
jgi:hypothetical protein